MSKEKTSFIEMPKALWEKWDEALRSGKYKQTRKGVLRDRDKFCCLGVLQHCISGRISKDEDYEVPNMEWLNKHFITFRNEEGHRRCNPYLPQLRYDAASANDDGLDFICIADAIKACVKFI